jgi:hypothetical protein
MDIKYTSTGIQVGETFVSKNELIDNINKAEIEEKDLVLLRLKWKSNKEFEGILEEYVDSRENILEIVDIIKNQYLYFGYIIEGYDFDIRGKLLKSEMKIIDDVDKLLKFIKDNPNKHSYNHSFLHKFYRKVRDYFNPEDFGLETNEEMKSLKERFLKVYN